MALQAKDNYFDTGSAGKPPRFSKDNFSLWKTRMELFLSGSDPQIPYFLENVPHVPTQTVHPIPAAGGQPAVPERQLVKPVTDWNDEDRRLVNIDTKARSLIAMSLPDDVFHSVCHLRSVGCKIGLYPRSQDCAKVEVKGKVKVVKRKSKLYCF
ncbi:hypothetical protein OSB04_023769 [Centaurea solstitialis]|uniref:DUF4219 domain-containing protein n=1 Tax=Centaurea solstitialis TaxID=347529 RepID=A0AA38T3C7_9ASTR|nr:hypothetical protein OSB04_023769 [Centaurea solstitialis]